MPAGSRKRILLVGATGCAGRELARHLLADTDGHLVLAARDGAKLDELHSSLCKQGLAERVDLLEFDAAAPGGAASTGFDLLVNATAAGPHNAALIRFCLEHGADWIDMQMDNELLSPSQGLRAAVENAGSCFVIQAGFHPGLAAPLVRYAALQMDTLDSAIVGSVIRDESGLPYTSGFAELVESFRDYKGEAYEDGRWRKLKFGDYPAIDFECGFGKLRGYPVEIPELRLLAGAMPGLNRTGFFVAGFNWFADFLVTPSIMLSARLAPRYRGTSLGRLLAWSTKKFARPPYGTVVQVDAHGEHDGAPVFLRLALFHESAYALTAIPTVAVIRQMLAGRVDPGIHLMGLGCDPTELLDDIERMGVAITGKAESTGH